LNVGYQHVVANHPRGQEQDPLGASKGAPQGQGAGAVSPVESDAQDGRCLADAGGGPAATEGLTMTEALVLLCMLVNAFVCFFLACLRERRYEVFSVDYGGPYTLACDQLQVFVLGPCAP